MMCLPCRVKPLRHTKDDCAYSDCTCQHKTVSVLNLSRIAKKASGYVGGT